MTITLKQAIQKLQNSQNPVNFVNDPEVLDFVSRVNDVGNQVAETVDTEYLLGILTFMKAFLMQNAHTEMVEDGDLELFEFLTNHMNSEEFSVILVLAFKFSAGLAIMEEMH